VTWVDATEPVGNEFEQRPRVRAGWPFG